MRIKSMAHTKLQIAISEWMREEIPDAGPLFKPGGVPVGEGRVTRNGVVYDVTDAAYDRIVAVLEALGLGD